MNEVQTILLILLVMVLLAITIWAGLFFLMTQLRRRYHEQATFMGQQLETTAGDLTNLAQFASQFHTNDDAPYGPLRRDLEQRLREAQDSRESCAAQLQVLRQMEPPDPASLAQSILTLLVQLRAWQQHLQVADALEQQMVNLHKQLTGAKQQAEQIRTFPLNVAGRVRAVIGATERSAVICQSMQKEGVTGDGIDTLVNGIRSHGKVLESIPGFMRQGTDENVLATATQDMTRDVWQKLINIEKPAYETLRRVQQWQADFNEARHMVNAMQAEVAATERILSQLPATIDAGRHRAEFNELRDAARVIQDTWRAPEVQRLTNLSDAAAKQVMATQQLASAVTEMHKNHQAFAQALEDNAVVFERIRSVMAGMAQAQFCPLRWGYTADEYKQLTAVQSALADKSKPRDPARLVSDLDTALDLGLKAGTLEARVDSVRDSQKQLQALISTSEFQTPGQWFHDAATLAISAARYAPANWQAADGLPSLKADATTLLKREQELKWLAALIGPATLTGTSAHQSVAEDELEQWIDRADTYVRERRDLQARLSSINGTLQTVERADQYAQRSSAYALGALGKLNQAGIQNVSSLPVTNAWSEVAALRSEGSLIAESLEDKVSGTVLDKVTALEEWAEQCAQALRRLQQTVKAEADAVRQNLMEQVDVLATIAPFDTEASMMAAQKLLNEVPPRPIGGKTAKVGIQDIAELVDQINTSLGRHTQWIEALVELEERVVSQVEPRMSRLDAAHAAASEKLQDLEALQQQIPHLKPIQVVCEEVAQLEEAFQQAQASLREMSNSGRTLKAVVSRLDSLISQFQHIANEGAGAQADLERDLLRYQEAVARFSQWARQLKRYRDLHGSDRVLGEAFNAAMEEIDQRFADIQRRYKGRPLPLDNACRELEVLVANHQHDIEVPRVNGVEVITPQNIMSV